MMSLKLYCYCFVFLPVYYIIHFFAAENIAMGMSLQIFNHIVQEP